MKKILTILLAALLVLSLSLPVFAEKSPSAGGSNKVTVQPSNQNAGSVKQEDLGNGKFKFTATPAEGYGFETWQFESKEGWELAEGSKLTDKEIIIQVTDSTKDIAATAKFFVLSPKDGDPYPFFAMIALITLAGSAVACKKVFA